MIKRADGKWFSDKEPEKKFSTLDEAREAEKTMVAKQPGKKVSGSRS